MNDVLLAGFPRNGNSFISHYLRPMSSIVDDLFSFGPIVGLVFFGIQGGQIYVRFWFTSGFIMVSYSL